MKTTTNNDRMEGSSVTVPDHAAEMDKLATRMDALVKETSQFTYIITHDLQAPLRSVSGFMELLEKKYSHSLDETGRHYIAFAQKEALRMKTILAGLLEYSRLDTVEYEFSETDLNTAVELATDDLSLLITCKNAQVEKGNLPVINGSAKLLRLLFRHLIENAVKFNESDSPHVTITAAQQYDGWEIAVQDNGIGVPEGFCEKIFTPMRRLHTDETKYPGTGMGLAVARKIAAMHGGTIRAAGHENGGISVFFTVKNKQ